MNRSQRRLANKQKPKYSVSRAEIEKMAGEVWEAKNKNLYKEIEEEAKINFMLGALALPSSERFPENTDPVNITWVNHKPEPYYADIKDKPFTATGCYCDGKWYWYSAVCQAYLDEYRYSENDYMDNGIEVIAWMPLHEPYKGE